MFTVINNLYEALQMWGQLLKTSSGTLEMNKYTVFVLKWDFTSEGLPYLIKNQSI